MAEGELTNAEMFRQLKELLATAETKQDLRIDKLDARFDDITNEINAWRPQLEGRVDALQTTVTALQRQIATSSSGTSTSEPPAPDRAAAQAADARTLAGKSLLGAPPVGTDPLPAQGNLAAAHLADARTPTNATRMDATSVGTDSGQGHGDLQRHRGLAAGIPVIPAPTPVTGAIDFQTPVHLRSNFAERECTANQLFSQLGQTNPSLQFPLFDGENPQLWQTLAEQYYSMFAVHTSYWVPMATLNFVGAPKVWLHSVRKKLAGLDWMSFCTLLCTRFGRDRHQLLIRQFYALRQRDTVTDYIEKFEHIMNNLVAYSDAIHPLYFLTRFIEGLRSEIRAVVLVQRPTDLDAACALALLQEEVADSVRTTHYRFSDSTPKGRPLPLPHPPQRTGPANTNAMHHAGRAQEASKGMTDTSKLQALKNYRRARGLCFTCGEKYGREHVCPATIQLHVVEELLEMMGADTLGMGENQESGEEETESLCTISLQALSTKLPDGDSSPSVLQLYGCVQGQPVTLLVDSGSTASFLNTDRKSVV